MTFVVVTDAVTMTSHMNGGGLSLFISPTKLLEYIPSPFNHAAHTSTSSPVPFPPPVFDHFMHQETLGETI